MALSCEEPLASYVFLFYSPHYFSLNWWGLFSIDRAPHQLRDWEITGTSTVQCTVNSCAANLPINFNFRVPLSPLNLDYFPSFVDGGGGTEIFNCSQVHKSTKWHREEGDMEDYKNLPSFTMCELGGYLHHIPCISIAKKKRYIVSKMTQLDGWMIGLIDGWVWLGTEPICLPFIPWLNG